MQLVFILVFGRERTGRRLAGEPPLAQRQQQTGRLAVFALGALHVTEPGGVADAARVDAAGDRALDAEVLAAGVVQAALGVLVPGCRHVARGDDGAGAAPSL